MANKKRFIKITNQSGAVVMLVDADTIATVGTFRSGSTGEVVFKSGTKVSIDGDAATQLIGKLSHAEVAAAE